LRIIARAARVRDIHTDTRTPLTDPTDRTTRTTKVDGEIRPRLGISGRPRWSILHHRLSFSSAMTSVNGTFPLAPPSQPPTSLTPATDRTTGDDFMYETIEIPTRKWRTLKRKCQMKSRDDDHPYHHNKCSKY